MLETGKSSRNGAERVAVQRRVFLDELTQAGIKMQHSLGQNFLYDPSLLRELAEKSLLTADDFVLEIGSGVGTFTEALLERLPRGRLLTIEIDRHLEPFLMRRLSAWPQASLLLQDVREVDLAAACLRWGTPPQGGNWRIAANLPYYLTTELITKLILELPQAASMAFLVQEEAAERLLAQPKNGKAYGPLAILCALYGSCVSRTALPRHHFVPEPHIDSLFLVWRAHENNHEPADGLLQVRTSTLSTEDRELRQGLLSSIQNFYRFLLRAFSQRRKTLVNNFRSFDQAYAERLPAALAAYAIPSTIRAEALDWQHLGKIFFFCRS